MTELPKIWPTVVSGTLAALTALAKDRAGRLFGSLKEPDAANQQIFVEMPNHDLKPLAWGDLSNVQSLPLAVVNHLRGDKGDKGDTGSAGKSAYQIWLDAGNTGTEADFLSRTASGSASGGGFSVSAETFNRDHFEFHYAKTILGSDGKLRSRGYNYGNCLGTGISGSIHPEWTEPSFLPPLLNGVSVIKYIANDYDSVAITSDGKVYGCGLNVANRLGFSDGSGRVAFTEIPFFTGKDIVDVKLSFSRYTAAQCNTANEHGFLIARSSSGKLYGCGSGGNYPFGSSASNLTTPIELPAVTTGVTVADYYIAGHSAVFARGSNGLLYARGHQVSNNAGCGILGVNTTTIATAWTQVQGLPVGAGISGVVGTTGHNDNNFAIPRGTALVLLANGDVYGSGDSHSFFSIAGMASSDGCKVFTKLTGLSNIKKVGIFGGYYGSGWAIDTSDNIWTWGYNSHGTVGDGTVNHRQTPIKPAGGFQGKVTAVGDTGSKGFGHNEMLIADLDGNLWFAGYDYSHLTTTPATVVSTFTKIPFVALDTGEHVKHIAVFGYDQWQSYGVLTNKGRMFIGGYSDNYSTSNESSSAIFTGWHEVLL